MKSTGFLAAGLLLSLFSGACAFQSGSTSTLAPSAVSALTGSSATPSLLGNWASQSASLPSPSSCGSFQWAVTSQTATSLAGTFSAQCAGGISISGTASGELQNGTSLPITASGTVTLPGVPGCSFSLTGTGTVEDGGNTLRVPYTGTTCLGPVQGTEVLRRPEPAAAAPPPPAVAPAPAPAPAPSPIGHQHHVGAGPLSGERAQQVVYATGNEFPHLTAPKGSSGESIAAVEELLRRMIWHLRLAGFQTARQLNPSGVLSNDKLTVVADGVWRAFDVFYELGTPGVPAQVQFFEVYPANPVGDSGIPD